MPDPYRELNRKLSDIAGSIDRLKSEVSKLASGSSRSAREDRAQSKRLPVDVDLLTDEEIDELRFLMAHEGSLCESSKQRVEAHGDKMLGMYVEMERLGLISSAMGVPCINLNPTAYWAVEKHDQVKSARARDEWRERIWLLGSSVLCLVIGWLLGKLG